MDRRDAGEGAAQLNVPLRLKIAQYLTAGFDSHLKALKEDGVIDYENPDEVRAAEQFLREAATAVLFVADNDETRLAADRTQGEYRETVQKIVDEVVADIGDGALPTQPTVILALYRAVCHCPYVTDPNLNLSVLRYSGHPAASFVSNDYEFGRLTATSPFPWKEAARSAMWLDVAAAVTARAEYGAMPQEAK